MLDLGGQKRSHVRGAAWLEEVAEAMAQAPHFGATTAAACVTPFSHLPPVVLASSPPPPERFDADALEPFDQDPKRIP